MRKFYIFFLLTFLIAGTATAADGRMHDECDHHINLSDFGDMNVDFENGSLLIRSHHKSPVRVEITEDYELYVDGRLIRTDHDQQRLIKEYYHGMKNLVRDAEAIGREGARLGVHGAEIGLKAACGAFKVLFTSFDEDELEEEIEKEVEKIEKKADNIERKADKLEEKADELETLYGKMRAEIPELPEIDW